MTCPVCGGRTKVVDTRNCTDHIVRYRACRECEQRFCTIEVDVDMYYKQRKERPSEDGTVIKRAAVALKNVAVALSELGGKYD